MPSWVHLISSDRSILFSTLHGAGLFGYKVLKSNYYNKFSYPLIMTDSLSLIFDLSNPVRDPSGFDSLHWEVKGYSDEPVIISLFLFYFWCGSHLTFNSLCSQCSVNLAAFCWWYFFLPLNFILAHEFFHILPVCMYVYSRHGTWGGQKKTTDPLELEL